MSTKIHKIYNEMWLAKIKLKLIDYGKILGVKFCFKKQTF